MGMEFWILDAIQQIRTPVLDTIMVVITTLGDMGMIWILLAAILLVDSKTRKTGVILFLALGIDMILCNGILKHVVARIRPCEIKTGIDLLIARPTDYSFPSGHTAASFAAVMALYQAKSKKLWKGALVLGVLIAFSRLYLYVHYPSDILGGMEAGLLCGYLGYQIEKKLELIYNSKKQKRKGVTE